MATGPERKTVYPARPNTRNFAVMSSAIPIDTLPATWATAALKKRFAMTRKALFTDLSTHLDGRTDMNVLSVRIIQLQHLSVRRIAVDFREVARRY